MSEPTIDALAKHGLFLMTLNNGDWVCGWASHVYHIEITQDHYADPYLAIAHTPQEAVAQAIKKGFGRMSREE